MLTIAKLGAHSLGYYEAGVAHVPGFDGQDYYGEGGEAPPAAWVAGRDQDAAESVAAAAQGVAPGQQLNPGLIEAWFNGNEAPSGAVGGRGFGPESVRGYDLTFAAPKSVSLLWGVAESQAVQGACEAAHDAAISASLAYLAEHAGYTRVHNPDTGQKDLVRLSGLSGVRYDHRTSRARDPHLHSHVLVHNRQPRAEGAAGFGSLDGTSLYHEARAAGMLYQATLRAHLSAALGVEWAITDPETGMADLRGFDRDTIEDWSRRHTEIQAWVEETIGADASTSAAATATAQKATRAVKSVAGTTTEQLRSEWRSDERGMPDLGAVLAPADRLAVDPIPPTVDAVLELVASRRSTYTRADVVEAAAALWPAGADPAAVRRDVEALAGAAMGASVVLTVDPDRQAGQRAPHQREGSVRYSSSAVLEREQRMLEQALTVDERVAVPDHVVAGADVTGLSAAQAAAMRAIAGSPQRVTSLVAPAGAGKTTSLRALRAMYEADGREVVGLAAQGAAVDVMVREGATSRASTVARLVGQLGAGRAVWTDRTVVVVDEAGMVGSADLATIVAAAADAGAKVVTVGDPEQLDAVKAAGGAFQLLADAAPDTQRLGEVWRQQDPAERAASLAVRHGDEQEAAAAAGWYSDHGRLAAGSAPAMLHDTLTGWQADQARGLCSIMLAEKKEWVTGLNRAAQAARVQAGQVRFGGEGVGQLRQGRAGVGDVILTRQNSYQLAAISTDQEGREDRQWVRNGQRWRVAGFDREGGMIAERDDETRARITLPRDYVSASTELGYASTVHAAQGTTVDVCRTVLSETASRSLAYVGLTRGRHANHLAVVGAEVGDSGHSHGGEVVTAAVYRRDTAARARAGLEGILARDDHDSSAVRLLRGSAAEYLAGRGADVARAAATAAGIVDQAVTATVTGSAAAFRAAKARREARRERGAGIDR